ncbi:MAG: hypothetical protein BGO67_01665 [Alphaproteobacteria bacterium 41-28]|nr:MAG: hypothetical protein BGO67_01665 [Alphaproteobacteria bacterium 41-28]
MTIHDKAHLISEEERESFHQVINRHGHKPDDFLIEVEEDQGPMDMNDINYVIIVKTKVTDLDTQKSKTYYSRAGSETWLAEFEEDLKNGYFTGSDDRALL